MSKIPKILHYCWFGPHKMNTLQRNCVRSWEEKLSEYEFKKWDENNVDMYHPFIQTAYEQKKWAFVADFIRLQKLKEFGGIYLDTDMLVLKPLDKFLNEDCFFGAEDKEYINAGIIGSIKNHFFINLCLEQYNEIDLSNEIAWGGITIPRLITKKYQRSYNNYSKFDRLVQTCGISIYPPTFFYPLPYLEKSNNLNYRSYLTLDSFTVHLWDESWIEFSEFQHFRKGNYWKGFKKAMCKIYKDKNVSPKYIRKNLSAIKESLSKKM